MNKLFMAIFLISMVIANSSVSASSLPEYYPSNFSFNGTLGRIDKHTGILVINDRSIKISARLRVYTTNTEYGTIHTLQTGQHVAIRTAQGNTLLTEIWVLPKGYKIN